MNTTVIPRKNFAPTKPLKPTSPLKSAKFLVATSPSYLSDSHPLWTAGVFRKGDGAAQGPWQLQQSRQG